MKWEAARGRGWGGQGTGTFTRRARGARGEQAAPAPGMPGSKGPEAGPPMRLRTTGIAPAPAAQTFRWCQ